MLRIDNHQIDANLRINCLRNDSIHKMSIFKQCAYNSGKRGKLMEFCNSGKSGKTPGILNLLREFFCDHGHRVLCIIVGNRSIDWLGGTVTGWRALSQSPCFVNKVFSVLLQESCRNDC